jgi:hypothetical protein
LIALASLGGNDDAAAGPAPITVDCDAGQTLAQSLGQVEPGNTIRLTGTCTETTTITTDRLTLDGQGTAILDGGGEATPVISIVGATGVTIAGVTVQNGSIGILGRRGADVTISQTTAQDNSSFGFQADENVSLRCDNCTALRNGSHGMRISESSNALFSGAIISNENGASGMVVVNGSRSTLRPDANTLELQNNADAGMAIFASSVSIIGGSVTAQNNQDGLRVEGGSSLLLFNVNPATMNQNVAHGFLVQQGSSLLLQNSTVTAAQNTTGFLVTTHSTVSLSGGFGAGNPTVVTLANNTGAGLSVSAASQFDTATDPAEDDITLTIEGNTGSGVTADNASLTLQQATIGTNAGGDVVLSFGTRATLNGNTIGSLSCDATVLLSGDTGVVCPAP